MIRSVAKHRYIKGRVGKARGRAHINYIAYRGGEEVGKGGRKFFDRERDDVGVREVKEILYDQGDNRGVVMHKLMLSPGMQEVDMQEYTREVLGRLEEEKRQKLEWCAVVHDNTDHQHAHVVIMGMDKNGHRVRLDREDYRWLRQFGDEYLDREHKLERYLDREIQQLLKEREYERGGDETFHQLMYGSGNGAEHEREQERGRGKKEREGDEDPERDRREFEQFDDDMRRALRQREGGDLYRVRGQQRRLEQAGRLSEYHESYTEAMARKRVEEISQRYPELADEMRKDIEYLDELAREDQTDRKQDDPVLDKLLGVDPTIKREQQQPWQTFESDRQIKEQEGNEDRERDPGEELFAEGF